MVDDANRLSEDDAFTYGYDANGNLISKTAKAGGALTTYSYDAQDQLIRIDLPGGSVALYVYDGLGRRIEKDVDGAVTSYLYDGADIALEFDGAGALLARYSHGPGADQPLLLQRDLDASGSFEAGEAFAYHADGLGSVTELTDSAGVVAASRLTDAYGNLVAETGGLAQPYAFTGREFDAESGLHYYRARYYDPATGRFIGEDPIGFAALDANLYRYVANGPTNRADPSGLFNLAGCGVGAVVGAVSGGLGGAAKSTGRAFNDKFLGGDGLDLLNPIEDKIRDLVDDALDALEGESDPSQSNGGTGCNAAADAASNGPQTDDRLFNEQQRELLKNVAAGAARGAATGCLFGGTLGVGAGGAALAPFTGFASGLLL